MVLESLKFGYLLSAAGNFYGDAHNVLFSGKNVKHKTIRSPRFLSKHYFSGFEFSSSDSFTTTFKNGVTGINPKIRGKYYVKWIDGDYFDWQNHVRELNAKNDKSAVEALLKGKTLSFLTLRDVCNAYANKPLKVIGSNYNFTFESEGVTVNSLADLSEWKNAVSVCTRTLRLKDYMRRAYLDSKLIEGKEIITNSSDISDGSLSLREEDEKSSLAYGKEYLKDRLSGLSDDKVKEQIFKWCKYLGNKAASSGTWNNDKVNFATYCMKGKDSPSRRNRRNAVELVKSKQPKVQTLGEYLQKEYLDHNYLGNKRFVSSAGEVSDSVYALRQDDEKNYESLSMRDKEFLQDRLKEKSLDLVKNEVFEWCNFLKSRSVVTKDRNLHNLRTYCLTEK